MTEIEDVRRRLAPLDAACPVCHVAVPLENRFIEGAVADDPDSGSEGAICPRCRTGLWWLAREWVTERP